MGLRIVGDVHGQVDFVLKRGARTYLEIIADCKYSVQLGDMGDAETYSELIKNVDPKFHRFFGGNHDHYDCLPPHSLGDFGGGELGGVEFFFVRGAMSIDRRKLVERGQQLNRKLWYEEEEIATSEHASILAAYRESKPNLVLSHTCPTCIMPFIQDFVERTSHVKRPRQTSPTNELLEQLLEIHRPKMWCFGHYHQDWHYREDGTDFHCVGEHSCLDVATL